MEDYKSNSFKSKEEAKKEEKKITPVAKGVKKKQSVKRKISEGAGNITDYIWTEVLIPAAKKAIDDVVTNGISMILYGKTSKGRKPNGGYTSYDRYSYKDRDRDREDRYSSRRTGYQYDDILFETRSEAMDVLERMDEIIDTYDQVSVADMYDLVDETSNYTDNKYGWTNLRNAEPERVRDGYILKLPKAKPIN